LLELDLVRKYVSLLMAKDFRQCNPGRYPIPTERVGWFIQATFAKVQTPYVQTIWAEIDDMLHIETELLGDTIDMTEWMYGSESLYERGSMDLTGFDRIEGRSEYAKKFPRVVGRLNSYERFASRLAEKLGVDMRVRVSGLEDSFVLARREVRDQRNADSIVAASYRQERGCAQGSVL